MNIKKNKGNIIITEEAFNTIREECEKWKSVDKECGGSLIGVCLKRSFIILYTVKTGSNATQSSASIITDAEYQKNVLRLVKEYYSNVRVEMVNLGDYHLHPFYLPDLSGVDRNTCFEILSDPECKTDKMVVLLFTYRGNVLESYPFIACLTKNNEKSNLNIESRRMRIISSTSSIVRSILKAEYLSLETLQNNQYSNQFRINAKKILREIKETKEKSDKAVISKQLLAEIKNNKKSKGELFGRCLPEEKLVQIIALEDKFKEHSLDKVGYWQKKSKIKNEELLLIIDERIQCFKNSKEIILESYDLDDYNSRNKGLMLSQKVKGKKVLMISCGSVNSRIGNELVRHGVEVAITDPETIDIVNPYRFGIQEVPEMMVGRDKVFVFKETVERNIPGVKVQAFAKDFCKEIIFFDKFIEQEKPDLIIVATDTLDSQKDANSLALRHEIPVLYVTLSDKAESGQILFVSGKKQDPCYLCFTGLTGSTDSPINLRPNNEQYGINASQEQQGVPALSVDISIISDIASKITLVILSGEEIKDYFKEFDNEGNTVMWFSTKPNTWLFENFAQKLVAKVEKNLNCPVCGLKEGR